MNTQRSDLRSTLDTSRMIGDHTCLSVSSCQLHWAWPEMLPRGHKTARTSQFSMKQAHEPMLLLRSIRNVIPAAYNRTVDL